jgi:GntP family gluconate:H+ symporter
MFVLAAADTAQSISYWPLGILAICVVFIVVSIVKFRIHPFLALILSALLAGLLSKNLPDANTENIGVFKARTDMHIFTYEADKAGKVGVKYGNDPLRSDAIEPTVKGIKEKYKKKAYLSLHLIASVTTKTENVAATIQAADQHGVPFTIRHKDKAGAGSKLKNAVTWAMRGFGDTAGGIGLVIALAAIIGTCMMGSGAADRVVRALLNTFGEQRSGIVLLLSGFLLSIPVFFDTVFFLLIPLARALSLRTGKSYTLYVIAMAGAGAITHSMVPPTPGPLMIADGLDIELGVAMMAGLAASILPAWLVLTMAKNFDKKLNIPMRDAPGISSKELQSIVDKKDNELPGLFMASIPVAFPVVVISLVSILKLANATSGGFFPYLEFLGQPNIAMLIAAGFAILTYAQQLIKNDSSLQGKLSMKLGEKLEAPLQTAGVIILITGAGGAFGGMIRLAGVGETIEGLANSYNISYILLAWLATAVVRIAQGSATVAMITGVGLMSAVIGDGSALDYHPLYIFLAIGFGSITLSWMNDSGFWVVQRLSGFTEKETLKTWSVLLTAIAILGLVQTLVFSKILPLKAKSDETKEQTAMIVHN